MGQIGPGTKRRGIAGDDQSIDRRVGFDLIDGRAQLITHRQCDRVAPLRVVEGDGGYAVGG